MSTEGKWGQVVRIFITAIIVILSLLPSICGFIRK
jgi:hypothetical protein